jgi:hypothetical protein
VVTRQASRDFLQNALLEMDPLLQKPPSTEPLSADPNFLDYYRILRGQIEHEDNLVGSRISWFVTSQSFLFSAYAIIATGFQVTTDKTILDAKHVLLVVIPSIGITTAVLILLAIFSGIQAMSAIRSRYAKVMAGSSCPMQLPPIQGNAFNRKIGMAAPVLLPPLFMTVWIFLLMRRLF